MKFKPSLASEEFIESVHHRIGARNKAVLGRSALFLALGEGLPPCFKISDSGGKDLDDETVIGEELNDVLRAALNQRAGKALDEASYRQSFRLHFEYGCQRLKEIWDECGSDQTRFVSTLLKLGGEELSTVAAAGPRVAAVVEDEVKLKLLVDEPDWSLNGPGTQNGLLVISGRMGSGKSQLALDLLAQLTRQGVRFIFFDLKGELESNPENRQQKENREKFLGLTGARYVRLIQNSLPINPLYRGATPQENAQIASEMAGLVRAFAPQLGAKQERLLRQACEALPRPDFQSLMQELTDRGEEGVVISIIEKIARVNLFAQYKNAIPFEEWLSTSTVIDFKSLGNDTVTKSLAVAFILNYLMKRLNSNLPPKNGVQPLKMVLFVDEAHLLLPKEGKAGLLGSLARQGRSWGFPVWLASQDADAFITSGDNATNFAELAECGVHFSPNTLSATEQRKILGGTVHGDLMKAEGMLRLQGRLTKGSARQFWRDGGR